MWFLISFLLLFFLFSGIPITFLVNLFFKKYIKIKLSPFSFLFPIFYIHHIQFDFLGYGGFDKVFISFRHCLGMMNPLLFFFGRFRFGVYYVDDFFMDYTNRIPSKEKVKYLPSKDKLVLYVRHLKNGSIKIEDKTLFPVYKLRIDEIRMRKLNFDMGRPLDVLFSTEYGECKIGNGRIVAAQEEEKGNLFLSGVTLGSLINLPDKNTPFLSNTIDLMAEFIREEEKMKFEVRIGNVNSMLNDEAKKFLDPKDKKIHFRFSMNREEYRLPMDMALRKLVLEMFKGLNYGQVVASTVGGLVSAFFKIVAPRKPKPQEEQKQETPDSSSQVEDVQEIEIINEELLYPEIDEDESSEPET